MLVWIVLSIGPPDPSEPIQDDRPTRQSAPLPSEPLDLADVPILGGREAPVGLLVFSDFQCPFCGRFAREALSDVIRSHVETGNLFVGFLHVPIFRIHPMAGEAARAAECGRQQGRFWQVHDALFAGSDWATSGFEGTAVSVGLDVDAFGRCMLSAAAIQRIRQDVERAERLRIVSTPTLILGAADSGGRFVAHRVETGAISAAELKAAIDAVASMVR